MGQRNLELLRIGSCFVLLVVIVACHVTTTGGVGWMCQVERNRKEKKQPTDLVGKKNNLEHEHGNPKDWLHNIDGRCSGGSYSQILFSQYFQAGQ